MRKHRVLPGFGRSCGWLSLVECALAKRGPRKSFRMRTYKKRGGGVISLRFSNFDFQVSNLQEGFSIFQFRFSSFYLSAGAGGVTSLGSRGVTEDVELPKEFTPVTSHSIAFVETYFAPNRPPLNQVNTCISPQVELKL